MVFLSSRPFESDAHKFYPVDYSPYQPAGPPTNETKKLPVVERRLTFPFIKKTLLRLVRGLNGATSRLSPDTLPEDIHKFYLPERQGARLLDFGCGTDAFLNHARGQGWATLGMDVSPHTIDQVRRSGHEALLISPGVWKEVPENSVDLVRMNHVLEHLYHPGEALAAIRSKMRAGGRLHIAVPNPRSFAAKVFRSRWWPLECPRHVILFSPAALTKFIAGAGFSGIEVRQETITKDSVRSLGYLLHDCGWIEHEKVTEMMHRPLLAELLFTPARIAALRGRADRFHLFARK